MRIRSVNVAMPRVIEHKGEEVFTAIFKRAAGGPRLVRRLNIDGDGQADPSVHGGVDKAVYAFPSEHFGWYREQLGHGSGQFHSCLGNDWQCHLCHYKQSAEPCAAGFKQWHHNCSGPDNHESSS